MVQFIGGIFVGSVACFAAFVVLTVLIEDRTDRKEGGKKDGKGKGDGHRDGRV